MKKPLIYLALLAFLAGPAVEMPVAEASSSSHAGKHAKSHGAKKAKAKSKTKIKSKAKSKVKAKSKSGLKAKSKAKLKAKSKSRLKASKRQRMAAPRVVTPLRAASAAGLGSVTPAGNLGLLSTAALVVDQSTGEALYAKNEAIPTPIASITKLMTAMVTLDAGLPMDEEITITDAEVDRLKGTGSRLAVGTTLTRGELMHLALIASENRAAAALSRAYPGGRAAFIEAMNRKARAIGMYDSRFVDGTGLNSDNRATAADLAKMVDAAYRYPLIREISRTGNYDVGLPGRRVVKVREDGKVRRVTREVTRQVAFHNTNALTRSPDWEIGVSKTGFINEAGKCLVMQARIADRPVIIVLLDSWGKWSRFGDANRIRKWLEQGGHLASKTGRDAV
ncbi:MAG: serine hydrolase [Pseudomonadota bacterium]